MNKISTLALVSMLLVGCAGATDEHDRPLGSDEAAFTAGQVSRVEGAFFAEPIDRRPPLVPDASCWTGRPAAGVTCANPPLPTTQLGTGSVSVRIRQYAPGADRVTADVRIVHPSSDGLQTVTRTFRALELAQSDGGYGPSVTWTTRTTVGALTYDVRLVFPWVGLDRAGALQNASVRIDEGADHILRMSSW